MKKTIALLLIVLMALFAVTPAMAKNTRPAGGVIAFFVGCCFGPRSGAAWNDGQNLHWTEWIRIIPIVGLVGEIINGIDGMNGMTTADMAKTYGSQYY